MTRRRALRMRPALLLAGALLAWGCAPAATVRPPSAEPAAPPPPAEPVPPEAEAPSRPDALEPPAAGTAPELEPEATAKEAEILELRSKVLEAALGMLGRRPRLDCSGYVLAAYRGAGLEVRLPAAANRSLALRTAGREVETPKPGDLAFFHDTYDRNRNGKVDDGITHVALVEAVDGTGVTLLHRGRRRVERIHMDLESPSDRVLNDPVRVRRRHDSPRIRFLAGELFTAFGALLGEPVTQTLQASRAEDTGERHPERRWQSKTARASKSEPPPSRSTRRRGPPPSGGCSGSCPPTKRSSSRSSASAGPGAPASHGP